MNLLQNAYNIVKFLENVFSALIMRFIWHKIKKLGALEKLENIMKCFFWREKRFKLSKLRLYQIEKAQNMPVLAGRLFYKEYKHL